MPTLSTPAPGQLKVMISSTALDLPNHRKAVMDAVLRAGCFPLAMEHGSATSDSNAIRFSLEMVDRADIYVGIFALRYGFVPDNKKDNPLAWSVTEHEYRRAVARGIPRLVYLANTEHKFSEADIDFDPGKRAKLQALKDEVGTSGVCGYFESPEKLHSLIVQSLFEEKAKHGPTTSGEPPAPAAVPHPPEFYTVPPYTLTTTFVGRRAELADLDAWATSPDPVMVVEAIGGMGKSALTWEWTLDHAPTLISGLTGRVWWSFYERGTSLQTFLRHALAYVTRQDLEALRKLDPYDTGQQLLAELRRRPYLLVLDGFERVLTAYQRLNKAQVPDDQVPLDERECVNPKDGDLLRHLVDCGPSKVLVSTRLMPRVLEDRFTHRPILGVSHLELEGLNPADALQLVRDASIHGTAATILRFADQFGRHALVLRIVCGMITDYRPKPGDFDAWRADPYAGGGLKLSELPLKQRYTHILEYAFRGLAEKPRQLLSRIAVLSSGADYDTIAVLNPFLPPRPEDVSEPDDPFETYWWRRPQRQLDDATAPEERQAIEAERVAFRAKHELEYQEQKQVYERYLEAIRGYLASAEYQKAMTNFHAALGDLEDRGLLQWDREANTYDLHPVIRAYAFGQLEERDRTDAYNAIGDHFASLPPEDVEEATELAHLKNSIEIIRALIGAGRFEDALRFYRGAIRESLQFAIGAFHIIVELMSPLLRSDRAAEPVLADVSDRRYATSELAGTLDSLGRSGEAISLYREAVQLDLEHENWNGLSVDLRGLATCMWNMNRLASMEQITTLAGGLDAAAGNEEGLTWLLLFQMILATEMGRAEDGESLLSSLQQRPQLSLLRSGTTELWFAVLRFYQDRLTAPELDNADQVAAQGRELQNQRGLSILRAEWELTQGSPTNALSAIEQALSIVRRTGTPASTSLGIRAFALARLGYNTEACEVLAEADEASSETRSRYPLFAAETWLALGDQARARKFAQWAYADAWADGPPYSHWYYLKQGRKLLVELGEPEPQLPPFDPEKIEPVPFEAEIRAVIEKLKAAKAQKEDAS